MLFGRLRPEGGKEDLLIPAQTAGQALLGLGLVEESQSASSGRPGQRFCSQRAS